MIQVIGYSQLHQIQVLYSNQMNKHILKFASNLRFMRYSDQFCNQIVILHLRFSSAILNQLESWFTVWFENTWMLIRTKTEIQSPSCEIPCILLESHLYQFHPKHEQNSQNTLYGISQYRFTLKFKRKGNKSYLNQQKVHKLCVCCSIKVKIF